MPCSGTGPAVAAAVFGVVLAVAAGVEIFGAATGVPFGDYDYGDGLGAELAGVPLVIPAAWAMTAYPALLVARRLTRRHGRWVTALVAGWALASWDVFLDPQMVEEGYWRWADPDPALPGSPDVPLTNYAGWLLVSVLLMAVLDRIVPDESGDECSPACSTCGPTPPRCSATSPSSTGRRSACSAGSPWGPSRSRTPARC